MSEHLCKVCRYPIEICKCDKEVWHNGNDLSISQDIKQTEGKVPLGNLLDFKHALVQVSKVREFGNKKYPDKHSYKEIPTPLLLDACMRHLFSEGNDEETGMSHYASAIVNLLMILEKDKV